MRKSGRLGHGNVLWKVAKRAVVSCYARSEMSDDNAWEEIREMDDAQETAEER